MPPSSQRPLPHWRLTPLAVAACLWAGPLAAAPLGAAATSARTAGSASASAPAPPAADTPLGCLIEPSRQADVGSALAGVLQRVLVDRGDSVRQGQVLAELRHEVERAQVDLARSHAHSQAELQGAQKAWDYARKKQARTEDLVRKEFVSRQALEQTVAEAEVAQARLAQAREQLRHSARELELAHAQLDNRTLRSPISGIVVERFRNDGERVEDKPVLRIATIDPLRVEMVLPATLYGRVLRGTGATVQPELASLGPLQGRVSGVDRVIDAASNTFRARLELPNPGGKVPAGLRCSVQFAGMAPEAVGAGSAAVADTPVRVARFADRYHPVVLPWQAWAAAVPAVLTSSPMALQPAAQLMAHLAPTAAGTSAPESPPLRLALSRELAAPATASLAIASSR